MPPKAREATAVNDGSRRFVVYAHIYLFPAIAVPIHLVVMGPNRRQLFGCPAVLRKTKKCDMQKFTTKAVATEANFATKMLV